MGISPVASLLFSGLLALYAFALVVFDNQVLSQLIYLIGGVMSVAYAGYALTARVKPQFPAPLVAYTLLVMVSLASIFWSIDADYSIGKARTMVLILINMFVVYNIIVHFKNATGFFLGLYAAIIFNLLLALGIVSLDLDYDSVRFGGSLNQPNLMGYIGHVTVFFAYLHILSVPGRRSRAVNKLAEISGLLLVCVVAVFITYLTGSRTALLLLAALVLWIIMSSLFKPVIAIPLIGVVLGGFLFVSAGNLTNLVISGNVDFSKVVETVYNRMESGAENEDRSVDGRVELARKAYELYNQQPLVGNGIGAFEFQNDMYAHNNYLEIMSSVGLVGLACMLAFYTLILREILLMQTWRFKLLFGMLLLSFMAYDFALVSFTAKFQMLVPMVMLACMSLLRQHGERSLFANTDLEYEPQRTRRRRRRRMGPR